MSNHQHPKSKHKSPKSGGWLTLVYEERFLAFVIATSVVFLCIGSSIMSHLDNPLWLALIFGWLFSAVLCSVLGVVRHADNWPSDWANLTER